MLVGIRISAPPQQHASWSPLCPPPRLQVEEIVEVIEHVVHPIEVIEEEEIKNIVTLQSRVVVGGHPLAMEGVGRAHFGGGGW